MMEPDLYMRVVAMSADAAKEMIDSDVDPVDLGPADPDRYRAGARVWGFASRKETATERSARLWRVDRDP
jgi:hypothetical protein